MSSFEEKSAHYKDLIDKDINDYCKYLLERTEKDYGKRSLIAIEPFCDILHAGGKRLRGMLVMAGYQMMRGSDQKMIIQAARAIEMLHTYLLVLDDIQDRSNTRRDVKTAHTAIAEQHATQNWKDDASHVGISLALNGAIIGAHAAEIILSNLEVDPELRIKVLSITNHTMVVTAQGQTNDLLNEVADDVNQESINNVIQWKTAHYSVLNPLHVGMVLAGADCEDTNAITQYALNVGKAYQITDDLLLFTEQDSSGKNPIDDVREGKQTLLTSYALSHGSDGQVDYIAQCLGDRTLDEIKFKKFKQILLETGSLDHAKQIASEYIRTARNSLNEHKDRWDSGTVKFLDELALNILNRTK